MGFPRRSFFLCLAFCLAFQRKVFLPPKGSFIDLLGYLRFNSGNRNISKGWIAVKSRANVSKDEHNPAHWMPPNRSYWYQYIEGWIIVKKKGGLSMDQAEVDTMKKGWAICDKKKSADALDGRH